MSKIDSLILEAGLSPSSELHGLVELAISEAIKQISRYRPEDPELELISCSITRDIYLSLLENFNLR